MYDGESRHNKSLNSHWRNCRFFRDNSVFVGDDPKWDVVGLMDAGIDPVPIDRKGLVQRVEEEPKPIRNLDDRSILTNYDLFSD